MRILYHHRTLADGAEGIHIRAMIGALRDLGHQVRLSGLADAGTRGRRHQLVERVRAMLPAWVFELASIGVNLAEYAHVIREIRRFRPELVYKRHARYDVAALLAARHCNVPTILEVNVLFTAPQYERFEFAALPRAARFFERRALRLATSVVAVSSPLARQVRDLEERDVVVVPNGVDMSLFDPRRVDGSGVRRQYGLIERLTVGWTGILREWHGLELLLEALVTLPGAYLLIVGDGPARSAVENRVTELGLHRRTILAGRIPHEDVPAHVAAMDIAVVADERTGVASPMKLVEYMAMARAVVAPRLENIADLIDDQLDGLLFRPGDAQDLAAQLHRLASDAGLRSSLGASARGKVERQRNWRSVAESVLSGVRDDNERRQGRLTTKTKEL